MKSSFLILFLVLASLSVSCGGGRTSQGLATTPSPVNQDAVSSDAQVDGKEIFSYKTLIPDLVRLANDEYGQSRPNYSDPDNAIGTPPLLFVKKVECEVIRVDAELEKLIKKTPETATYHTVVLLKDARNDFYAFTLTSTVPDKSVLRLQHYGPLTNENPEVVNLPIRQRRLKVFPIDFNTGKPLEAKDGRCVYIPYPYPADQEFWLFGANPHSAPLQGLYRNDRYKNVDEVISLITQGLRSPIPTNP